MSAIALYFSSRDTRGPIPHRVRRVVARRARRDLLGHRTAPVLSPGPLGAFDDAGVTSSCVVDHGGRAAIVYYTGWSLGTSVPFYLNAGLARSDDGGLTFRTRVAAPLLDRSAVDPYLTASPWVHRRERHLANVVRLGHGMEPRRLRDHAIAITSSTPSRAMDFAGNARASSASTTGRRRNTPSVGRASLRDGNRYRMWYSYRGPRYRIGYAESADGIVWTRMDSTNVVPPSPSPAGTPR